MVGRRVSVAASVLALGAASVLIAPLAESQMDPNSTQQNSQTMNQNLNSPPSQSNNPTQTGTQSANTMRDSLGAPGETGQQMADRKFLRTAAEGGIGEVQLGMLAVQKGGPDVKVFAQKLVDDHMTINADMKSVADTVGVMLPKKMNKADQAEYDKLQKLAGDDFDKEYILYMFNDHRKDLRDFREEAAIAADPTLQAEATRASGMIRDHMMMVVKLAKDKNVTLPARPPRPAPPAGQ